MNTQAHTFQRDETNARGLVEYRSLWPWRGPLVRDASSHRMRQIADAIAESHGLTLADLQGPGMHRKVAWPRQQAFAETYATGRYSTTQIGRFYRRHHTTVISGIRSCTRRGVSAPTKIAVPERSTNHLLALARAFVQQGAI